MAVKTNRIGLELTPYRGGKTTLCAGCGHNAIFERIIDAFFEMGAARSGARRNHGVVSLTPAESQAVICRYLDPAAERLSRLVDTRPSSRDLPSPRSRHR
jgi:hypothetical protein